MNCGLCVVSEKLRLARQIASQTGFVVSDAFDRLKPTEQKRERQRLKGFIREYRALKKREADSRQGTLEVADDGCRD